MADGRNLCANPALASNAGGWTNGDRTTRSGFPRSYAYEISHGYFSSDDVYTLGPPCAITAGSAITVVVWIEATSPGDTDIAVDWYQDGTYQEYSGYDGVGIAANTPTPVVKTYTVPANIDQARIDVSVSGGFLSSATAYVSCVRVDEGHHPDLTYADGDTQDWVWDDRNGSSTSHEDPSFPATIIGEVSLLSITQPGGEATGKTFRVVADAGPDQTVDAGDIAYLNGSDSYFSNPNLVENSDFELGVMAPWSNHGDSGTLAIARNRPHSGVYSLSASDKAMPAQHIYCSAGTPYDGLVWVYVEPGNDPYPRMYWEWEWDSGGSSYSEEDIGVVRPAGQWCALRHSAITPSEEQGFTVFVHNLTRNVTYVDGAVIRASAPNLTYSWAVTDAGGTGLSTTDLSGADTVTPSFPVPDVNATTAITVTLTITDPVGNASTDVVVITARPATPANVAGSVTTASASTPAGSVSPSAGG
jgi:hypothetical protein